VRNGKISRQILEHCGGCSLDLQRLEKAIIGLRRRLWFELRCDDIEHVLEVPLHPEPSEHRFGVAARAVGQDDLATWKLLYRVIQGRIRLERGLIDLMHEIEKIIRPHAMLGHHPAHGSAVALVIVLLQPERFFMGDFQEIRDVVADAFVHLLPEIDVVRVKRVVEIEDPGLNVLEAPRAPVARGVHAATV
jgi:hypothetical protein